MKEEEEEEGKAEEEGWEKAEEEDLDQEQDPGMKWSRQEKTPPSAAFSKGQSGPRLSALKGIRKGESTSAAQ